MKLSNLTRLFSGKPEKVKVNSAYLTQDKEIILLGRLIPHLTKVFIDVGAEKGAFSEYLLDQGLIGFAFEPLPRHLAKLQELLKGRAVTIYSYALDREDAELEFHIACDAEGKESDFFHSLQMVSDARQFKHARTIPVQARSLQSLISTGEIPAKVGVLKIDTEGNDLRVLQGMGVLSAEVVICEFFRKSLYNGWEMAGGDGLRAYAKTLGYTNCLSIGRSEKEEHLVLNPSSLAEDVWGNLFFFHDSIYPKLRKSLEDGVASLAK